LLLLRGQSDQEAQERLEALQAFWQLPLTRLSGRVEALRGDTSLPQFGLDSRCFERVASDCSHVVHCAALVRMNLPLAEARASSVSGAENVIELARLSRRLGRLEKVEFLSTVGVGGDRTGVLPERWITERRGYHNTYEQAKAEAEVIVARGVADGLPITVHRPSMVVGDSQSGEVIRFQIFYHLVEFLSGRRTLGFFPAFGATRLDIVPVDYVADAVVWSSGKLDTRGLVLHLCAGAEGSPRLDELQARVRESFVAAGHRVPPRISLPPAMLRAAIPVIRAFLPPSGQRALSALPIFLAYLSDEQSFGNTATRNILGSAGIALPSVDGYLGNVLERYLRARPNEAMA